MPSYSVLTLLLAAASLVACSENTGPDRVRGPAILSLYGDTSTVALPTTAQVGVPVALTVTSFGGGCIGHGGVEFAVHGGEAVVRPYRIETIHLPPNMACTSELRIYRDSMSLVFAQPGNAHVRIVGIQRPGDTPYTIQRGLIVLP